MSNIPTGFFKRQPAPTSRTAEPKPSKGMDLGPGFIYYPEVNKYRLEFPFDYKPIFDECVDELGYKAQKAWNPYAQFKRPQGVSKEDKFWWANPELAEEFHRRVNAYMEQFVGGKAPEQKPRPDLKAERASLQNHLEQVLTQMIDTIDKQIAQVQADDFIPFELSKDEILKTLKIQRTSYKTLITSAKEIEEAHKTHE